MYANNEVRARAEDLIACMENAKYLLAKYYAYGIIEKVEYMDLFAELEVLREKFSYAGIDEDQLERIDGEYFKWLLSVLDVVIEKVMVNRGGVG